MNESFQLGQTCSKGEKADIICKYYNRRAIQQLYPEYQDQDMDLVMLRKMRGFNS